MQPVTRPGIYGRFVCFAMAAWLTGCGGNGSNSAAQPPAPSVNLSAEPSTVEPGGSSTLTWSSTNATQCSASGGWSGPKAMSGTESTPALDQLTTFALSCTGPGGTAADSLEVTVESQLITSLTLAGSPHEIDIYRAAGATRAIVFLHGGGGHNYMIAYAFGLNSQPDPPSSSTINWAWLEANGVIALFPQGQRQTTATNGYTWNNHVMQSGQDDVAFLQSLAAYIDTAYGITDVTVVGHSNGGMMVNRMWCESPETFDAYVAISGPASAYYLDPLTPCQPAQFARYYGIVGDVDDILQVAGNWEADTWSVRPALVTSDFVDPTLIGEWRHHQSKSLEVCGELPAIGDASSNGVVDRWSNCDGNQVLDRVIGGDHSIESLETIYGTPVRDLVIDFLAP